MADIIEDKTCAIHFSADLEIARFNVFYLYLCDNPGFGRILQETQFIAPAGFYHFIGNMAGPYRRRMLRARLNDEIKDCTDREIDAVMHILMDVCVRISQVTGRPNGDTFSKACNGLLRRGLFNNIN